MRYHHTEADLEKELPRQAREVLRRKRYLTFSVMCFGYGLYAIALGLYRDLADAVLFGVAFACVGPVSYAAGNHLAARREKKLRRMMESRTVNPYFTDDPLAWLVLWAFLSGVGSLITLGVTRGFSAPAAYTVRTLVALAILYFFARTVVSSVLRWRPLRNLRLILSAAPVPEGTPVDWTLYDARRRVVPEGVRISLVFGRPEGGHDTKPVEKHYSFFKDVPFALAADGTTIEGSLAIPRARPRGRDADRADHRWWVRMSVRESVFLFHILTEGEMRQDADGAEGTAGVEEQ